MNINVRRRRWELAFELRDKTSIQLQSFSPDESVPPSPTPPEDKILQLYSTGQLLDEVSGFHLSEEEQGSLIEMCVYLHNLGKIDLLTIPNEVGFAERTKDFFFEAQHFYCEVIPKLSTKVATLMSCCRVLIDMAGDDGAAYLPNDAFRKWCANNPTEAANVVMDAKAGNPLAKLFVTFALQALGDLEDALYFVQAFEDERRLCGLTALSGITFRDTKSAHDAVCVIQRLVTDNDDEVRSNALFSALTILHRHPDPSIVHDVAALAAEKKGHQTIHGIARAIWQYNDLFSDDAMRISLEALETVDPNNRGTVRLLDSALRTLLRTPKEDMALNFLTRILQNSALTIESFESTSHELRNGNPQRFYELIVRWLFSGSISLCNNINDLVATDRERTSNASAKSLDLTPTQQIFLCRKAIGFLFIKPIACCSIIVSMLRVSHTDARNEIIDLLTDPILINYGGKAKDYLKSISCSDDAFEAVQCALNRNADFFATFDPIDVIRELHPSDYQRDVVRQRTHDEMRATHKLAESKSVLLKHVHRSTILYGKRSLNFVLDRDGSQRTVAIDLKSLSVEFELPRQEILDPVGLDYMLRVFRIETLK